MNAPKSTSDGPNNVLGDLNPGSQVETRENGRTLVYRVNRVDRSARMVEGVLMNEKESIITGFVMSFEAWMNTTERASRRS